MQLFHLVSATDWSDVKRSLLQHYPDARKSVKGYRKAFLHLRQLRPVATAMRICLQIAFCPDLDEEPSLEVVGRNGTFNRDWENSCCFGNPECSNPEIAEVEFGIEYEPWSQWLGMEIDADTLAQYPASEIVAHCLLEMTFYGFDEADIDAEREELQRLADEINAMTEEERKAKLIPLDEALQKMRNIKGQED